MSARAVDARTEESINKGANRATRRKFGASAHLVWPCGCQYERDSVWFLCSYHAGFQDALDAHAAEVTDDER